MGTFVGMVAIIGMVAAGSLGDLSTAAGALMVCVTAAPMVCAVVVTESLTSTLRDAVTLTQACQFFSPKPSVHCVWRWAVKGTRGVRLETWNVGGRRVTTPRAIERFLLALNAASEPTAEPADNFAKRAKSENAALKAILG